MPAITLAWPEAGWFGYDRILAAADLGYRGKPFNWVTMPDQFTLASLERQLLDPAPAPAGLRRDRPHLLARPLDADPAAPALGRARRRHASSTPTPPPATRPRWSGATTTACATSTACSLDYVPAHRRRASPPAAPPARPLLVVLGDHQPARLRLRRRRPAATCPIHVIGPPGAPRRASTAWGWTPGLIPAADAPAWPMDAFRDRFLAAFGPEPAGRRRHAVPLNRQPLPALPERYCFCAGTGEDEGRRCSARR